MYDKINFLFLYRLRYNPCYSFISTFPYVTFIYYTHSLKYSLWLYTMFGSGKNSLIYTLTNTQEYTGKQTFLCRSYLVVYCILFLMMNRVNGHIYCQKYVRFCIERENIKQAAQCVYNCNILVWLCNCC